MSGMEMTIDALEGMIVARNEAATTTAKSMLNVGSGEITQLASDCCGSNNYPEEQQG